MIRYKCSKCGARLESPDEIGGRQDQCPLCGQVCQVPLSKAQQVQKRRREREQRTETRLQAKQKQTESAQLLQRTARVPEEDESRARPNVEELAKLRFIRRTWGGFFVKFNIFIDERQVARLAYGKTVSVSVVPGRHVLRVNGGGAFRHAIEEVCVAAGQGVTWEIGYTWFGTVKLTRSTRHVGDGVDHRIDEPLLQMEDLTDQYGPPSDASGLASAPSPTPAATSFSTAKKLAIGSIICGAAGMFCPMCLAGPILVAGVIMGIIALHPKTPGHPDGRSLAIAGIVISGIGLFVSYRAMSDLSDALDDLERALDHI